MTNTDLPKTTKRFIGDKKNMIVHDTSKDSCPIDQEAAVPFDTVDEAHVSGFKNCEKCLSALFINPIWTTRAGFNPGKGSGPNVGGGTFARKEVPSRTIQNKAISGPPEKK